MKAAPRLALAVLLATALMMPSAAGAETGLGRPGLTERVSVGPDGAEGHGEQADPFNNVVAVSSDGRFVAFSSAASDLVPGDTNFSRDVFVHDRVAGGTERVSVRTDGAEAKGGSYGMGSTAPDISADGRFVAFMSEATNLVTGDFNGGPDVFVHDRVTGATEAVSVDAKGKVGDNWSRVPSISADGRFVAFDSSATNLVTDDSNNVYDVFVRDRQARETTLVSRAVNGTLSDGVSYNAAISGDGSDVAFYSSGANLVAGDTNGYSDVFVAARAGDAIERVSVASDGAEANDISYSPSISEDGSRVAFVSKSSNLVPTDINGTLDAFVHDRTTGRTGRITVTSSGLSHDDAFPRPASPFEDLSLTAVRPRVALSPDGRFAAFVSRAANLSSGDANGLVDAFVRDLATGTTERVSVTPSGGDADGSALGTPAISADGRVVAFTSTATNLIPGDGNGEADVFARERGAPVGVVDLRAERDGEHVLVSGAVTTSGISSDATDEVDDVDVVDDGTAGLDLLRASVVWRPERGDVLVRWEPTEMPSLRGVATGGNAFEVRSGAVPSAGGTPGLAYSAEFRVSGTRYFVQVAAGPGADARLFDCTEYPCTQVAVVEGSLGSAGLEADAIIPLSALGAAPVGRITGLRAEAGLGDDRGLVLVLDQVALSDLIFTKPAVEVGVAPPGASPEAVPFQPATLTGNAFSVSRNAGESDSVAWVRVCVGTICSVSHTAVTG
jgi:Tol biopolymer transport system component